MNIVEVVDVRGRGIIAVVEEAPKLQIGILVHQGENAWKIIGIETMGRRLPIGLLLRAEEGCPERPEKGTLEL